jgi:hypothetical protein
MEVGRRHRLAAAQVQGRRHWAMARRCPSLTDRAKNRRLNGAPLGRASWTMGRSLSEDWSIPKHNMYREKPVESFAQAVGHYT